MGYMREGEVVQKGSPVWGIRLLNNTLLGYMPLGLQVHRSNRLGYRGGRIGVQKLSPICSHPRGDGLRHFSSVGRNCPPNGYEGLG
jgi:hypothetical protein